MIASAATRSAIEGSSFGDNVVAGLPDVIGQALGRAVARAVTGPETSQPQQGFGPGWEQTEDGNWVNRTAIDRAIAGLSNPVIQNGGIDTVGESMEVSVSAFGIAGSIGEQVAQISRVYRTGLSSTLGTKGIATTEISTTYSQFSDEMQAELVHGFAQTGKNANGHWLQNFLADLYERHGIDGTVQSAGDLQAVVDAVAAGSAIPRGQIKTVTGVSEYAQGLGAFAQSPTGTFTYNYVNDMAFGVPGVFFDHERGLEIISEKNPNAAIAGQAVAFAAGLAGGGSSLAIKAETSSLRLSVDAAESVLLNSKVVLQGVTDRAVADLAANPVLARSLMSPGSYNHLVERTGLGPASYGKAVERLAARYIERDSALSAILQYQSKPFKSTPDFFGFEGQNLRTLDITTVRSTAAHTARPYGAYTEIVTYPGLPSNLVFPR